MAEPITVKGGSISIEFEDLFDETTAPERKKKFKHRQEADSALSRLVIITSDSRPNQEITLSSDDQIEIYYNAPEISQL